MASAVDCHVHLYPDEVNRDPSGWAARRGEPIWAAHCARRRRDGRPVQGFPGADRLLRDLDAAGVGRAVLLGWYFERPESCALQNRFFAECVRAQPDRLSAFAALQPAAGPAAVRAECARARDEGLVGLGELCPPAQGYGPDDPGLRAALELASDWGWPVNLHVTDPDARPYPGRVETPFEELLAPARAFPRVPFILSHWGGLLPLRGGRELPPNLWYDTSASPLLYGADIWSRFVAGAGAGRLLFGSDHPLNLYPRESAEPDLGRFVSEARRHLPPDSVQAVMSGNARCLLRIP